MPATVDPYYQWLGIPPKHQPPHHYRLLGIELFEDDSKVISVAAARQIAHVRTYQIGQYSDLCHRLLNELSAAKACLVNAKQKAAYDAQLSEKLSPGTYGATRQGSESPADSDSSGRVNAGKKAKWKSPIIIAVAGVGLALLLFVLVLAPTDPADKAAQQTADNLVTATAAETTEEKGGATHDDSGRRPGAEAAESLVEDKSEFDDQPPTPQIRLIDIPDQQVPRGRQFRLAAHVEAAERDQHQLIFQLIDAPPEATIDETSGEIQWTPPVSPRAANFDVTFTVLARWKDAEGKDQRTFKVTVLPRPNAPPSVSVLPSAIASSRTFAARLAGQDPDGDQIRYEYSLDNTISWQRTNERLVLRYEDLESGTHQLFVRSVDTSDLASAVATIEFVVPDFARKAIAEPKKPREIDPFIQQVLLDLKDKNTARPENLIDRSKEYYKRGHFLLGLYYGLGRRYESEAVKQYEKVVRRYKDELDGLDDIGKANYVATLNNLAVTLVREREIDDAAQHWAAAKQLGDVPAAIAENARYALHMVENGQLSDRRRPITRDTLRELGGRAVVHEIPGWLYMAMVDEEGRLPDFDSIYQSLVGGLVDGIAITGNEYRDPWCLAPYCTGQGGRTECPARACKRGTITTHYFARERDPINGRPIVVKRTKKEECPICGGDGFVSTEACKECGGNRTNPNFSP